MTDAPDIIYEVSDGVGLVTLNRPRQRNAITFEMYDRIKRICLAAGPSQKSASDAGGSASAGAKAKAAKEDSNNHASNSEMDESLGARVIIFTGGGDAAFAAGTDISLFREFNTEDAIAYEHMIDDTLTAIEKCSVPTIGALFGACTGGGAAIASALDIRLAARDMRLGVPIARTLGNCLAIGNLNRLVHLVGEANAKYILMTSSLIGAEDALRTGFVAEIHETHEDVKTRANQLATEMLAMAPLTLDATKRGLRRLRSETSLPDDRDLIEQCFGSQDFKEGVAAFFDKRKPQWKGR